MLQAPRRDLFVLGEDRIDHGIHDVVRVFPADGGVRVQRRFSHSNRVRYGTNCLPRVRGLMIDIAPPQTSVWIHGRHRVVRPCGRLSGDRYAGAHDRCRHDVRARCTRGGNTLTAGT